MPNRFAPLPVTIPAEGPPTCVGVALQVVPLVRWQTAGDYHGDAWARTRDQARRAHRDGYLLCLRPTADRPACVGLSPTQFADASPQPDFAARALVVDPYDADGNDIRERPCQAPRPFNIGDRVYDVVDRVEGCVRMFHDDDADPLITVRLDDGFGRSQRASCFAKVSGHTQQAVRIAEEFHGLGPIDG